jgi:hypothetical protein
MKNQRGSMRKKTQQDKKMTSQLSVNDVFHMQLVWILTTERKSVLRVEKVKGLNFLLLILSFYLL